MREWTIVNSRRRARIGFGGHEWGAYDKQWAMKMARDPTTGTAYVRVYFAALARLNPVGCSPFAKGELLEILAHLDVSGEARILAKPQSVDKAIRKARDRNLIASDANQRCLAMGQWTHQTAKGASPPCDVHPGASWEEI